MQRLFKVYVIAINIVCPELETSTQKKLDKMVLMFMSKTECCFHNNHPETAENRAFQIF